MLDTAADLGISEDEFWGMLPRELHRRTLAFRRRFEHDEDAAWGRALLITNHVRDLINMHVTKRSHRLKPLTLDQLKRKEGAEVIDTTSEEWAAYCAHLDRVKKYGKKRVRN